MLHSDHANPEADQCAPTDIEEAADAAEAARLMRECSALLTKWAYRFARQSAGM